jgi:acyl-coenzyme A thioesterase PaaI-like protein
MNQPLTEEQQLVHRQALRDGWPRTPFMGWLGIVFERYEPDDVVIRLPFRDDLTNDRPILGAAKRSDLLCHARTVRRRKELIFTEITGTDADGEVVAHAVQTYRIV